jgi:hypothetical protein
VGEGDADTRCLEKLGADFVKGLVDEATFKKYQRFLLQVIAKHRRHANSELLALVFCAFVGGES